MLWTGRLVGMVAVLAVMVAACGGGGGGIEDLTATTTRGGVAGTSSPTIAAPAGTEPAPAVSGVDRSGELLGTWEIITYRLPDDALTNVLGEDAHLTFAADGTLTYGTGCNQGSTTYVTAGFYVVPDSPLDETPEGQSIALGPEFVQTEIGCEGFLGEQDVDIPLRMQDATRFRIFEGNLLLLDEFMVIEATVAN